MDYCRTYLISKFLKQCDKILYGALALEASDGAVYNFQGKFPGPNATLKINDWKFLYNTIAYGDIGLGEAYIDGLWESDNLEAFLTFGALNDFAFNQYLSGNFVFKAIDRLRRVCRQNTKSESIKNVQAHYDLNNDFYSLWLDKSMTYSAALFRGDNRLSLEKAQEAKYNRILKNLALKPGDNVLEIGCGWGSFAEYLARKNINTTAITLSGEQAFFANKRIRNANLGEIAQIKHLDYRDITGMFDYIVSIGMFEHVGSKYWQTYFDIISTHLKKTGKALIQTILVDEKYFNLEGARPSFITKYIFPGGCLPSHAQILEEIRKAKLICNESFAFGKDYAITISQWLSRFEKQLSNIKRLGFDDRFIRKWRFYLAYTIAGFVSGRTSVAQFEIQHL
jgi:cyclopropane-fatty-acyl-phospholipid synthase